jgi:SAM-dependent methyltransferase
MTRDEISQEPPRQLGNLEANLRFLDESGVIEGDPSVLEIGSGTGTLLHELVRRGCRVQGVELRQAFVDQAFTWYGALPLRPIGGVELPFPDHAFDVVMSFDVFEHIPDSDAHLREVVRVLRPGGSYVLQTPNRWTNTIFETIRWRSFTKWRADHCSLHSLSELRSRLQRHGFNTVRAYDIPVVNDFFRAKVRRYAGAPGTAALTLFNPDRMPIGLRTNLFVKATLASRDDA